MDATSVPTVVVVICCPSILAHCYTVVAAYRVGSAREGGICPSNRVVHQHSSGRPRGRVPLPPPPPLAFRTFRRRRRTRLLPTAAPSSSRSQQVNDGKPSSESWSPLRKGMGTSMCRRFPPRRSRAITRHSPRFVGMFVHITTTKASYIDDARIERLEALGFVWNSHQAAWTRHFQELAAFQSRFGHCNVPTNYWAALALSEWVVVHSTDELSYLQHNIILRS
jgi:hypothetical protein